MSGEELFEKLRALPPEERAARVFFRSDYLDPVQELQVVEVAENWGPGLVAARDFWPEMEEPRPAVGSKVIVL